MILVAGTLAERGFPQHNLLGGYIARLITELPQDRPYDRYPHHLGARQHQP